MISGDPANVLSYNSSLAVNFNDFGYNLTVDSPVTDLMYTPNPTYPKWIFHVWYEVTISAQAFAAGGGYGSVKIPSIHASPSKIGTNTCPIEPVECE